MKPVYDGEADDEVRENKEVAHERSRIASGMLATPNLVSMASLRKEFKDSSAAKKSKKRGEKGEKKQTKKKVAVADFTLGIPQNECFGLLGPNGAG